MADGASPEERLRAAAKSDNVELASEAIKQGKVDLNATDGLGMTALHYCVHYQSPDVCELLLDTEGTDVDLPNRLDRDTPLHLAARIPDPGPRKGFLATLLDAGADPRIRNRAGQMPQDCLPPGSDDERRILREFEAEREIGNDMVANDVDDAAGGESGSSGDEQ